MKIIIGAPVYKRDWILPAWFDAIEKQDFPLEDIGFVFEAGTDDDETISVLSSFRSGHPEIETFEVYINSHNVHLEHPEGQRRWPKERYLVMAEFRNNLLDNVIDLNPDRYFSLDTDIILENPRTISELAQMTAEGTGIDAICPVTFMTFDGTAFPNTMNWADTPGGRGFRLNQYPFGTVFPSDVIMGAVMMNRKVYKNARYRWHRQGEDLGWATNCHELGYQLYVHGQIFAAHVMGRAHFEDYKTYGDPRKAVVDGKEN